MKKTINFPIEVTPIYLNPMSKPKTKTYNWIINLEYYDGKYRGTVNCNTNKHKKEFPNLGTDELLAIEKLKEYCKNYSR